MPFSDRPGDEYPENPDESGSSYVEIPAEFYEAQPDELHFGRPPTEADVSKMGEEAIELTVNNSDSAADAVEDLDQPTERNDRTADDEGAEFTDVSPEDRARIELTRLAHFAPDKEVNDKLDGITIATNTLLSGPAETLDSIPDVQKQTATSETVPLHKIDRHTARQFHDWKKTTEIVDDAAFRRSPEALEMLKSEGIKQATLIVDQVASIYISGSEHHLEESAEGNAWSYTSGDGKVTFTVQQMHEAADKTEPVAEEKNGDDVAGQYKNQGNPDIGEWPFREPTEIHVKSAQMSCLPDDPLQQVMLESEVAIRIDGGQLAVKDVGLQFTLVDQYGKVVDGSYEGKPFIRQFLPENFQPSEQLSGYQVVAAIKNKIAIGSALYQTSASLEADMLGADDRTRSVDQAIVQTPDTYGRAAQYIQWGALFDAKRIIAQEILFGEQVSEDELAAAAGAQASFIEFAALEGNQAFIADRIDVLEQSMTRDGLPEQAAALARAYYAAASLGNAQALDELDSYLRKEADLTSGMPSYDFDGSHVEMGSRYAMLQAVAQACPNRKTAEIWINRYIDGIDRWDVTMEYYMHMVASGKMDRSHLIGKAVSLGHHSQEKGHTSEFQFNPQDIVLRMPGVIALFKESDMDRFNVFEAFGQAALKAEASPENLTRIVDAVSILRSNFKHDDLLIRKALLDYQAAILGQFKGLKSAGINDDMLDIYLFPLMASNLVSNKNVTPGKLLNELNGKTKDLLNRSGGDVAAGDAIMGAYNNALAAGALTFMSGGDERHVNNAIDVIRHIDDVDKRNAALVESWKMAQNESELRALAPGVEEMADSNFALVRLYERAGTKLFADRPEDIAEAVGFLSYNLTASQGYRDETGQLDSRLYAGMAVRLLDRLAAIDPTYEARALAGLIQVLPKAPLPYGSIAFQRQFYERLLSSAHAQLSDRALIHRAILRSNDFPAVKAELLARYAGTYFNPQRHRR